MLGGMLVTPGRKQQALSESVQREHVADRHCEADRSGEEEAHHPTGVPRAMVRWLLPSQRAGWPQYAVRTTVALPPGQAALGLRHVLYAGGGHAQPVRTAGRRRNARVNTEHHLTTRFIWPEARNTGGVDGFGVTSRRSCSLPERAEWLGVPSWEERAGPARGPPPTQAGVESCDATKW